MPPPVLSIVVPAFQEARRLPPTMRELARLALGGPGEVEVLIVVERSPDGTLEIARETARQQADSLVTFEIIDGGPQRGKGHAVRTGMLRARGDYVFYMDADLSVPLREVPEFLQAFRSPEGEPADVLLGNRQHTHSRITRPQAWWRRSMGQIFNRILQNLGLTASRDTQCGFKAFRRDASQSIFQHQQVDGFAFDVEVLLLAQKLGWRARDLPVEWVNSPDSRVRVVRDSLRMLWDAFWIRRRIAKLPQPVAHKPSHRPTDRQPR